MFTDVAAFSGFSVDDLDAARAFYADVLGLRVLDLATGMLELDVGPGPNVLLYPKRGHRPATFTVLNFPVADVGAAVQELVARGVQMLRYDGMPQDADAVMRGNGPDIAWFADPAGNVLSVLAG